MVASMVVPPSTEGRRAFFYVALVLSNVVHVLAVLAMLGPLAPGVDVNATVAARAAFVAEHATRWRLGWAVWQLTAASDLALSVALALLLGSLPGRRGVVLAWLAVVATLAAMVPDQWGEALIVTQLVDAARASPEAFAALERRTLIMTGTCGESLYAVMGILWTAAAFRAKPSLLFAISGAAAWLAFLAAAIVNARAPGSPATVAFNGAGFGLLGVFLVFLGVQVGRALASATSSFKEVPAPLDAWLVRLVAEPGFRDQVRVVLFRP